MHVGKSEIVSTCKKSILKLIKIDTFQNWQITGVEVVIFYIEHRKKIFLKIIFLIFSKDRPFLFRCTHHSINKLEYANTKDIVKFSCRGMRRKMGERSKGSKESGGEGEEKEVSEIKKKEREQ